MERRDFLLSSAALAAGVLWSSAAGAAFRPSPANGWRTFEVVHAVEVQAAEGTTRVWVPLPSVHDDAWIRPMGNLWNGNADSVRVARDPHYGAEMLVAEWHAAEAPVLEVTSRFATRDRALVLSAQEAPAGRVAPLTRAERRLYTRATELLPTDGIVKETAREITRNTRGDETAARAIYDWIVENTFRNPETRGCGLGDIRSMLVMGDLSGKCADLNALYVGLARSVGLPARDVYGLRVADSRFGYKSLGKRGDVTRAQHCRAEVWLERYGWVPVDPADVRKVVLEEEPDGLDLDDPRAVDVRERLFGAWEMNWLAYNTAHDLALPGSRDATVPFLMYPQGETAAGLLDALDPANFRYRITSRELS